MLKYFRSVWSAPSRSGGEVRASAPSERLIAHLLPDVACLENAGNHLVERRILDAHVHDGVPVEDGAEQLRHACPIHLELGEGPLGSDQFAELRYVRRRL